jgi:glycosyltransferase involved in cell wall biosynthesis
MTSIVHITSGLGLGGAEHMLADVVRGLMQRGFSQHVVSLRGRGAYADVLEAARVPVHVFDIRSALEGLRVLGRIRRLVGRIQPDVVQGWMYHGDLAAAAVHRLSWPSSRGALLWNIRNSNMDADRYATLMRTCARLSSWPDVVVSNSDAGVRAHVALGYRARRMVVVPNGIDTDRFRPDAAMGTAVREEFGLGDGVIAIHVARVDPMKDHESFLAAMASLPAMTGVLVGTGTQDLPLPPNVRALGARRDVERLYAAGDLVVSSSAFGEGFSNALAEGMSAGLVPVSTDVGDAAHIVGDTGQVVSPGNPAALAAGLHAEATLPASVRRARGARARARICELFTPERAITAYAELYEQLVRDKSLSRSRRT